MVITSNANYLVKLSFYVTYLLLMTTATITIIEALRTKSPEVRHILNLETCISIVAAFFYSRFVEMLDKPTLDYAGINNIRYTDWLITTPLMLLALCLALSYNSKSHVKLYVYLLIIMLNFVMLWSGYMGEQKKIDKKLALVIGFGAFIGLFAIIWYQYVKNSNVLANWILFTFVVIVWGIYGLVYMASEKTKNIVYNTLDVIAKCFIGLFLWAYYTRVLVM